MADTSRARDMLTTALNKTPKPPIIVDDILVTELNLGSVPPDLEILEVGDLAEDRFRGIFKITYSGDAFLTLKTRVQANPLNTYLSQKPSFASPQPLAAASGLTIPLQITLSDIRLSGFIIIVFSRQKGLTIVFRNDPLESLKVSSTFDSIPFVREYLQKEIEGQLRLLFMDDLPEILHRLSLRYLTPESLERTELEERVCARDSDTAWLDPLNAPPHTLLHDVRGEIEGNPSSVLSNEASSEHHLTFSERNMAHLASLAATHRTLSLNTPIIRDAVFRAWTAPSSLGDHLGFSTSLTSTKLLYRGAYSSGPSSSASSIVSGQEGITRTSRPSLSTFTSFSGSTTSNGRSRQRQKKNRIVDLRRRNTDNVVATPTLNKARPTTPESQTGFPMLQPPEREGDVVTPPQTPPQTLKNKSKEKGNIFSQDGLFRRGSDRPNNDVQETQEISVKDMAYLDTSSSTSLSATQSKPQLKPSARPSSNSARPSLIPYKSLSFLHNRSLDKSVAPPMLNLRNLNAGNEETAAPSSAGGVLEQTVLLKMAAEIARKMSEEKQVGHDGAGWLTRAEAVDDAPPAYVA